jgi:DNA invertase Pin-like site-specific DNA recombinase
MLVGYARASAADQDLSLQEEQLRAAGCELIFQEKRSGLSRANREELETALKVLRPGDALVVTRLDRLARSLADLLDIAGTIKAREGSLRVLARGQEVDTSTAAGELFFHLLGAFAQFETRLRADRQAEGIAKAKAEGRHLGRPRQIDDVAIRLALDAGERPSDIAKRLGIGRTSVYRVRDAFEAAKPVTAGLLRTLRSN